jgi:hypothetical protein
LNNRSVCDEVIDYESRPLRRLKLLTRIAGRYQNAQAIRADSPQVPGEKTRKRTLNSQLFNDNQRRRSGFRIVLKRDVFELAT